MSSIFDDPARGPVPRPERPGWARGVLITAVVLLVLFFAMSAFTGFWTDRLWFRSVGYSGVFTRLVVTKSVLFVGFGALLALVVVLNMVLAYRTRPRFRPASPEQIGLDRYRQAIDPIRLWVTVGVGLVVGAFAGASGAGTWRDFLLWRNGGSFGRKDPYFHKDIGFYVFDLPWLHHLVDFAMATTVVSLLAAVLVHYLYAGIRLQATRDRLSGAAAAQISVLLGFFVLAKAADYWLDRYDLLNASGGLVTGITYTDDHAVLPAKTILMSIALICAVLFFANVVRRTWMLPSVGLGLLLLSAILLGLIWPGAVQQFQVNPSQSDKEPPYIQRNIEATRAAYDIADVKVTPYGGQTKLTPDEQREEVANAPGIRLVDPKLIQKAFDQQQQLRRYYSVADVLDVDRYIVKGRERDVVLGAREIDQTGMTEDSKNWSNLHTVYTHGYGVIAAYGNQRNAEFQEKELPAEPEWAGVKGANAAADLAPEGYTPQIYFGEKSPEYSIVGKASKNARDVELDQPSGDDTDSTSTYDGDAGVGVGSLFRKVLYAWKYGEPNIVLSERVNAKSKILYVRSPAKMVEKVAPWLTVDADPVPAIVDGKVVWLLDGYTTTDQYPLSQRGSYKDMTTDSLASPSEFRTLPTDEINYMRNAVKAVVDAYDGTVTLYAWDEKDPLLKAWRASFPGTVKDRKDIPEDLLEHMRYPEDMFKVQRYQLARYHVTDANTFYEDTQRWEVPKDPTGSDKPELEKLQPPYRLSVRTEDTAKDGTDPMFSLTSTYVPYKKQNLAAFISVDADASRSTYGSIRILELPTSGPVKGPGQVANDFATDATIQEKLTRFNAATTVHKVYGNLLTLPVGDSLLYVQPLYTQKTGSESSGNFPVLNFVLVSFGDRLAIGTTMSEAIADVLRVDTGATPAQPGDGEEQPVLGDQVIGLLQKADDEFAAAKASLAKGDLAGYAAHTDAAERFVNRALVEAQKAAEPAPAATPTKAAKSGS
jgi:uncharacterized membrane protein (UPF0182 family)